ncbi:MAG: hypothetical protein R3C68_08885 [Myxococcota bacterium]
MPPAAEWISIDWPLLKRAMSMSVRHAVAKTGQARSLSAAETRGDRGGPSGPCGDRVAQAERR